MTNTRHPSLEDLAKICTEVSGGAPWDHYTWEEGTGGWGAGPFHHGVRGLSISRGQAGNLICSEHLARYLSAVCDPEVTSQLVAIAAIAAQLDIHQKLRTAVDDLLQYLSEHSIRESREERKVREEAYKAELELVSQQLKAKHRVRLTPQT